jgi:hypothetical protein
MPTPPHQKEKRDLPTLLQDCPCFCFLGVIVVYNQEVIFFEGLLACFSCFTSQR